MHELVLVNVAVHPTSHSWPTDRRLVLCSAGKMWARRALLGRVGIASSASCVDSMCDPSGRATWSGVLVVVLLVVGARTERKCPVHPVSMTALVLGGEEPSVVSE